VWLIAGVALVGGVLVGLGIALHITAFGFAGLAAAIGFAGSLIVALLSPMGLLVGLAVALGAYLLFASDAGGQALARQTEGDQRDAALTALERAVKEGYSDPFSVRVAPDLKPLRETERFKNTVLKLEALQGGH
jgi:hypothetical protein